MIYRREKTLGLDFIIDRIQVKLHDKLSALWNTKLEVFPRCYVLENKDDERTIEHYLGNNQYTGSLIVSEQNKIFFTAEDNQERVNNRQFETKVSLYAILDLSSIYPQAKDRVDGIVLMDIVNVLDLCQGIDRKITVTTNYQDIYSEFNHKFDNQQPYYYLKIEFNTLPYSIDKSC
ncbi:hypothetical protein [Chryseobacterium vrystaatense]|uniref:Uncharacterized protein n=1 Tax=Chryseobacterium vrystaatense TaxID=307480 RepID=A0A1M4ZKK1_9FLAO|nr:hypothetical protein [Chryseobacterium vrystaatense]SHF18569.1 hypothetical protein SAMN02787073_1627 [Chryseobacterium vrystaatense]